MNCDPVCEIQSKVSNYEISSIEVVVYKNR